MSAFSGAPELGHIELNRESATAWADRARKSWKVRVQVFERSLNAGGVQTTIFVAVINPKRSK